MTSMTKYNLLSLLIFITLPYSARLSAQENLLLNPGMEEPAYRNPKSWTALGSVDYYQDGKLTKTTVEGNTPAFPPAASGKNYVGIRAFDDATEVLTGRLAKPMVKDNWYKIGGKVRRPAADCNRAVYGIAVVVSDTMPKSNLWYGYDKAACWEMLKMPGKPGQKRLIDPFEWTEVFTYYQAKGGERFLWLGNFPGANAAEIGFDTSSTQSFSPEVGLHCLYHYYYDDFSVTPALDPNAALLTVRDITFNSGSTAIAEVNDPQMGKLLSLLHDFPNYTVEVTGHTDSDGKDAFNLQLSAKRAEAVKLWLTGQGVEPGRITAKGLGETQPAVLNDTEEHKALNRRVEIRIGH